ncbi:DUF192 domain-containing protein [Candidatus Nomurabacteria bacterium]|nr:DUF192 domain-containing protein [Candidatus Nomurabacteria bacterium]
MKDYIKWVVVVGFLAFLVFLLVSNQSHNLNKNIKIGGVVLKTELADTVEKRIQGLSGREVFKEDESMLFIFDFSAKHSFWMRDMNFAIDIIWLDENKEVVSIQKNAEPSSYPNIFVPTVKALYVLEVVSGFVEKNNLKVGDKAEF